MNEDRIRLLQEKGFSFWGTVTASVSHELNNVISIIHEYSGLLEDLAAGAETGRPIPNEKLVHISERIAGQVARGKGITGRLNRFAHSTDESRSTVNLSQVMADTVELAKRFADLKAVRLVSEFPQDEIAVTANAFLLRQAVFTSIRLAIESSEKDDDIHIAFQQAGSKIEIRVQIARSFPDHSAETGLSDLGILLEELGGRAEVVSTERERDTIRLLVPLPIHQDDDPEEVSST